MCGIFGYVGTKTVAPLLVEGLRRLEYRGYDSAGLCTLQDGRLHVRKCMGRVSRLGELLAKQPVTGQAGISHTRWATHGLPSDANAHPHLDRSGKLALVHNGIIENYGTLRAKLQRLGHKFLSQTDTEVLSHLIGHHLDRRLGKTGKVTPQAVSRAILSATREATGTYAIAVLHRDLPGRMFGARRGSPLVVGVGQGETILASDVSPVVSHTNKIMYLLDGDVVDISDAGVEVIANGQTARRPVTSVNWSAQSAELGKYAHYMLKEIHEQPDRVADVLKTVLRPRTGSVQFESLALQPQALANTKRIVFVACGTSYHAALVGEYLFESLARIPVEVEFASEMRYRNRPVEKGTLLISVSQSGETADTLAAIRSARAQGVRALSITNVAGSTIARESDADIQMRAGPEIGVASTKAFEMQLVWLTLIALAMGRERGHISVAAGRKLVRELQAIPAKLKSILAGHRHIQTVARKYSRNTGYLFMGRLLNYPIAMEGALKLKEIAYVNTQGYASAEMKHGPIALISPEFPSVFISPRDSMYDKNMSNLEEIKARKGSIIAVATQDDREIQRRADDVLFIPATMDILQPLLTVIPLQLLAYYIAVEKGCDVDKPRNLAKSVTVE